MDYWSDQKVIEGGTGGGAGPELMRPLQRDWQEQRGAYNQKQLRDKQFFSASLDDSRVFEEQREKPT